MTTIRELATETGIRTACDVLSVSRSSYYRATHPPTPRSEAPRPARGLSLAENEAVREVLNCDRFADEPPRQVYATLLDEGSYLCHWRTMYRLLAADGPVRERRDQLRHPLYDKPELLATAPNELWSWDISKMRGPEKWVYFYLYVIMDVFSRYVVGWMVAPAERSFLARDLIETTCARQGIDRHQLTIHADRGSPMTSKTVGQLLVDLGVEKTHSRPHVSNDNPYSEAHFKTMKYRPDYPKRFGSLADARAWAREFFLWYNHVHHHSALGLMPPAAVHYGWAGGLREQRGVVLAAAYEAHPERFPRGIPVQPPLQQAVWINKPNETDQVQPSPNSPEMKPSGDGSMTGQAVIVTVHGRPTTERAEEPKPRA